MPIPESDAWKDKCISGNRWVAIHCEPTTWTGKNWPADRWAELIGWLIKEGWNVTLVGTSKLFHIPGTKTDYGAEGIADIRMMTSPMDLACALHGMDLFIGHDSFPLHVAQAQGVPVVGLFGATRAEFILTDGSPSVGINGVAPCAGERHRVSGVTHLSCDGSCMRSITVEQVKEAVLSLIAKTEALA